MECHALRSICIGGEWLKAEFRAEPKEGESPFTLSSWDKGKRTWNVVVSTASQVEFKNLVCGLNQVLSFAEAGESR